MSKKHPVSVKFHERLQEMAALHDRKEHDYGKDEDPLSNVRSAEEWGVKPWIGVMIRLNDKVRRLQTLARKGNLKNESAADSLRDICVYSIIASILLEEENASNLHRR